MRFSKYFLAATCIVLLGTACNTVPVGEETLSVAEPGCILPEVESMETPQISKAKENAGEGETQEAAGCILPDATE